MHFTELHDASNTALLRMLPQDQITRVMEADADIDAEFLGFVGIYDQLARIIPRDWTVVDLGCAYAPQCFFFRDHAGYIGVDLVQLGARFAAANTTHLVKTIADFSENDAKQLDLDRTFAICSYVPPWHGDNQAIARATFKNLFVYYPAANRLPLPI